MSPGSTAFLPWSDQHTQLDSGRGDFDDPSVPRAGGDVEIRRAQPGWCNCHYDETVTIRRPITETERFIPRDRIPSQNTSRR